MFDVRMDTAKLGTLNQDIRMDTAKFPPGMVPDVKMETARGAPDAALESTMKKFSAMKLWEREALESPEVKRKATVAQLCRLTKMLFNIRTLILRVVWKDFLDYYFQNLGYLAARKERRALFDADTKKRNVRLSILPRLLSIQF